MSSRKMLMVPGPTEVEADTLDALARPVVPHYGTEWGETYKDTCEDLKKFFQTKGDVILLNAPGMAGVELAIANLIEPGSKVLNVLNGFFGEWSSDVIKRHKGIPIDVEVEYGKAISPDEVRSVMRKEHDIKLLFAVHNESSTGAVNPIRELGEIAREFRVPFAVDFISSFGGTEIKMDDWGVTIAVGYSSKALGGINGVTPVALQPSVWESVRNRSDPMTGRFLNLNVWRKFIDEWGSWGHPHPTSMPTSVIMALRAAIAAALKEGLDRRYKRHRIAAEAMRAGAKSMGLQIYTDERVASNTLTVLKTTPDIEAKLREIMYSRYDILIAGGLSKLAKKTLRIAHMGTSASPHYILPTLTCLAMSLRTLGIKVNLESSVYQASEVFEHSLS
jgi:aspartate aminotransferase-like enzyme